MVERSGHPLLTPDFIEIRPLSNSTDPVIINLNHVMLVKRYAQKNEIYAAFVLPHTTIVSDLPYSYVREHLPINSPVDNDEEE